MPVKSARKAGHLVFGLLHAVLAKNRLPGGYGPLNGLHALRLAHGNKLDAGRIASGSPRGLVNFSPKGLKIGGNLAHAQDLTITLQLTNMAPS